MRNRLIALLALLGAAAAPMSAAAQQENYYYPSVNSEEAFTRQLMENPPPANRVVRTAFMTQITKAMLAAPENPRYVMFAKGAEAEHMIIVALDDQVFKTIFRARAVLAQLTSNARGTEFFIKNKISAHATWFDLAKLLGFEDIVISDGDLWSHRVKLN